MNATVVPIGEVLRMLTREAWQVEAAEWEGSVLRLDFPTGPLRLAPMTREALIELCGPAVVGPAVRGWIEVAEKPAQMWLIHPTGLIIRRVENVAVGERILAHFVELAAAQLDAKERMAAAA